MQRSLLALGQVERKASARAASTTMCVCVCVCVGVAGLLTVGWCSGYAEQ